MRQTMRFIRIGQVECVASNDGAVVQPIGESSSSGLEIAALILAVGEDAMGEIVLLQGSR